MQCIEVRVPEGVLLIMQAVVPIDYVSSIGLLLGTELVIVEGLCFQRSQRVEHLSLCPGHRYGLRSHS